MAEFIIFGLGLFGRNIASQLQLLEHDVVCVDIDRGLTQELSEELGHTVAADATSEAALRELGVANYHGAVVAIGNNEASILATLLLKRLGVPRVVVKATSELHGEILSLVGADDVIFPEKDTAVRLAHGLAVPNVLDYLSISQDTGIARMKVPAALVGASHTQANIESRYRVRIIAVIRGERVVFGSAVGQTFNEGDEIICAGRDSDLQAMTA
jgi:trk system potassium uptake protein TrkA